MRRVKLFITAALAPVLLTACGLQPASQYIPDVDAGPALDQFDSLDGAEIVVTSKEFTEQLLLGKMLSLVLASKDATVIDRTNTKGSRNVRESMLRGDSDLVWEYTGTGWINYLGHDSPDDEGKFGGVDVADDKALYEAVAEEDLDKNGIYWSPPAPFNNTYAIAVKKDFANEHGLESMSDITKVPEAERNFCLENEFSKRTDGWSAMVDTYDLSKEVPKDQVTIMDSGVIYSQIGVSCEFGEVFDTDGRIVTNDLVTLDDDEGAFPIYNPSLTVRDEIHSQYPQISEIFVEIGNRLDTDTMRDLNNRVDMDGEVPVNVAQDWLTKEGFLAEA